MRVHHTPQRKLRTAFLEIRETMSIAQTQNSFLEIRGTMSIAQIQKSFLEIRETMRKGERQSAGASTSELTNRTFTTADRGSCFFLLVIFVSLFLCLFYKPYFLIVCMQEVAYYALVLILSGIMTGPH